MRTEDYDWRSDYNWVEAFHYADFGMDEVDYLIARDDGENDFEPWIMVGRLRDKNWFFLTACCDYTGWDCQASGQCYLESNLEKLIQWSLGDSDRRRLKLKVNVNYSDKYET